MRNQRGSITLDFILAFVLVMGLSGILFSFSLTLTVSSVVQYMTFAAARNLQAGHHSKADQSQQAVIKFQSLQQHPVLAPLFRGNWFELQNPAPYGKVGNLAEFRPEFNFTGPQNPQANDLFVGFAVTYFARILDFNIPFFGSTTEEGDGRGEGFRTEIGSFLSKEPSARECTAFNNNRFESIKKLNVESGIADYSQVKDESYISRGDNGC